MKQIRISEKYWSELSEKEQKFLQKNVYDFGLMNCKRIITLSRYFDNYDDIVNFSRYDKNIGNINLFTANWLVIKNSKVIGIISKTDGIGITERIKVRMNYDNELHEVWNNWNKRKPSLSVFKDIAI